MDTDIRRDADQLMRYYGELMRRLTQNGVRDVAELLTLYEQLQRAVSALTPQEISWACDQVQALIRQLIAMDSNLQALRRLKLVFSQVSGPGDANARPPA
jgi:ubiquinone biosynthesis protein UbiJ